jgi:urease accessory protein
MYGEGCPLIVEQVVGNLQTDSIKGRHVEKVFLPSEALSKRIQRVTTDHGREIGIRLRSHTSLANGDILWMDETSAIVIEVVPEDLLVISPRSMRQMGEIAHQLGNRHIPAQFEEDTLLVQYDYLIEELLLQLSIPFRREMRSVREPFRHVSHHHVG